MIYQSPESETQGNPTYNYSLVAALFLHSSVSYKLHDIKLMATNELYIPLDVMHLPVCLLNSS